MLTPEEIASRSFLASIRGYDREEVRSFLTAVADDVARLQHRIEELEAGAAAQPDSPAPAEPEAQAAAPATAGPSELFAEIGKETQRILEAAQEAGEELRRSAREEGEREVKVARAEAVRLIAEGERRREAIEAEVQRLGEARDGIAGDLREVGRSIERALRDVLTTEGAPSTMREAVAAAVRADREAAAGASSPPPVSSQQAFGEPSAGEAVSVEEPPAVEEEPSAEEAVSAAEPPAVEEEPSAEEAVSPAALPAVEEEPSAEMPASVEEPPIVEPEPSAEEAASVEEPPAVEPKPSADEPVSAGVAASAPPEGNGAGGIDAALLDQAHSMRAQALAPLHPKLVRKLKRALQDLQNGMLDRLRRAEGRGRVADFLPDSRAVASLGGPTEEFLVAAWRAGSATGGVLAGRDVDVDLPAGPLARDLAASVGEALVADLDATLRAGLAAREGPTELTDRIGQIFSDIKETPVEEQAALALLRVYEEGLHAAWRKSGAIARRWAPLAEPACDDPRCAENHRAGPVPLGEPFPSGHRVPPVRAGCDCTTVPVLPQSEPSP